MLGLVHQPLNGVGETADINSVPAAGDVRAGFDQFLELRASCCDEFVLRGEEKTAVYQAFVLGAMMFAFDRQRHFGLALFPIRSRRAHAVARSAAIENLQLPLQLLRPVGERSIAVQVRLGHPG